jgi:hypothetical protein
MSTTLRPPLQMLRKDLPGATVARQRESAPAGGLPAAAGWMERLARWAERQPSHHRMGSIDAMRHF